MSDNDQTIAAISTPPGSGGIAVIRISGTKAIAIADKIYHGGSGLKDVESHKSHLGKIREYDASGKPVFLDEALFTVFRAPNSYTREDIVEISCHGGRYLSGRVLELLINHGARPARAGEFTERAFLNGRLDLSQAEAVADLIAAKTEWSLKTAGLQFQGALSKKVRHIRQQLLDICSMLELELDFAEEDVEFADKSEVEEMLKQTQQELNAFLQTYERGKIIREGVSLVIAGRPNVGKSSLLNALLKEERAIVTEIPGTTRDVLEEQLDIRGVLFRVLDTAGIRSSGDIVEQLGVERSLKHLADADIVLLIFDKSSKLTDDDANLLERLSKPSVRKPGTLIVLNKNDLPAAWHESEINKKVAGAEIVNISAKNHTGLVDLEEKLLALSVGEFRNTYLEEPVLTNLRQKKAVLEALSALENANKSLSGGLSSEFVALDLREAMSRLGEIIGEVTTEDILGNIFSRFCIGK